MWLTSFEPQEHNTSRMNTIAKQIRELQNLAPAQLADRYAELFGKQPRVRNASFLRRQVAWKLQEREFGGLSDRATTRLNELIKQIDLPLAAPAPRPRPRIAQTRPNAPSIGTTLVKQWHDMEIRVEVREGGFEWHGTLYTSLSAVARAVTGTNWNGRLFFGLTKRRAAQ
jgi:hypothetical protein